MKILKIFGVVVGVHVFALMLIFANPGCSSTNKPAPAPADTAPNEESGAAAVSLPQTDNAAPTAITPAPEAGAPTAVDYPPSPTVRFAPTRPGTAAANALETQPVTGVTPASTYTVKPGDSLWSVAHKNRISIAELAVANNLKQTASIRIGQKLIIPAQALPPAGADTAEPVQKSPAEAAPVAKTSGAPVKHVVKPGETLGGIARKYGVKLGDLAALNAIADPARIRPGQELTIPGWKSPAGGGSASRPATAAASSTPPANAPAAPPPALMAPAPTTPGPDEVPTVVLPAPESGANSGATSPNSEPPVIQVEEKK